MTTPIIFFSLSGFVMVYLILHKRSEHSNGRGLIYKTLVHKADTWAHKRSGEIKHIGSFITKRNLALFLNYSVVIFLRVSIFLSSAIKKEMSKLLDKLVRKQETLTKTGAASAFLKQISENKQNGSANPKAEHPSL